MSLKVFHIFFIVVSILFTAGLSFWAYRTGASDAFGAGSACVSCGLTVYFFYFVKKARSIIT